MTLKKILNAKNKNVIWSFASKFGAAFFFFLLEAYLARTLKKDLYGEYQYFLSTLVIIATLSYFGIPQAANSFAAQYNGRKELRPVMKSSLALRLGISSVLLAVVFLLRAQIDALVNLEGFSTLLLLGLPTILMMAMGEYLKNVFIGLKKAKYHFIMNLIEFSLKLGLAFVLLKFYLGLESVVNTYTLAILAAVIVGLFLFRKLYRAAPGGSDRTREFAARIFRYSLPLAVINLGYITSTELNTQMLGFLTTKSEVALFGVGNQIINKLPQIALALSMGIMPEFAQISLEDAPAKRREFLRLQGINLAIFASIAAGILLLGPFAIPFIYGGEFSAAVLPLQIMSFKAILFSANIFLNQLLDYQGRANARAVNFTVTIVLNILLNLYLIPRYGAIGAAVSTTISYLPYFLLNAWVAVKIFRDPHTPDP